YLSAHSPAVTESGADLVPLEEVLRRSDILSCHVPLTTATTGLLGREQLSRTKPGAVVVNTSRGPVVDEDALYDLLVSGHLGGAALDVRAEEPPRDTRLHALSNVILAPHIAGWTREAHGRALRTVAADVDRVLRGEPP